MPASINWLMRLCAASRPVSILPDSSNRSPGCHAATSSRVSASRLTRRASAAAWYVSFGQSSGQTPRQRLKGALQERDVITDVLDGRVELVRDPRRELSDGAKLLGLRELERALDQVPVAVGLLVDRVERRRLRHEVGGRVAGGAQEPVRDALDFGERLGGDVLGATGSEPGDHDGRAGFDCHLSRGAQRSGTPTPRSRDRSRPRASRRARSAG